MNTHVLIAFIIGLLTGSVVVALSANTISINQTSRGEMVQTEWMTNTDKPGFIHIVEYDGPQGAVMWHVWTRKYSFTVARPLDKDGLQPARLAQFHVSGQEGE